MSDGGLFIFDINTEHKLKNIIGNNTFILENDDVFCSWQNEFDKKRKVCEFYLTFFMREKDNYVRFDEQHEERAYSVEEIKSAVENSGMRLLGVYDNLSFGKISKNSERIFFVAQEQGKSVW